MKTTRAACFVVLLGVAACAHAQNNNGIFTVGLRIGANHVTMTNLTQTFCTNDAKPTFELDEKRHITPTVSIVAQYRFPTSLVAVEGSVSYFHMRNEVEKTATHTTETYDIRLNHITLGMGAKVTPVKGAFVKAAICAGPCLNGTSCVKYDATGVTNAAKMQRQERISQAVKGRTIVRADLSLGYDFPTGLTVEAFYGKCLTDLIEVGVNDYGYTEQRNDSQYTGVSVGWLLTKNGFSRKR